MARSRAPSLWVVNRSAPMASAWSAAPEFYVTASEGPLGVPLRGFTTKKAAEAARTALERSARETTPIGPFLRFRIRETTAELDAAAKAANLLRPDYSTIGPKAEPLREGNSITYTADYTDSRARIERAVAAWWAQVSATVTPEANAILWDALFPDFRFYTVSRVLFEE